MSSASPDFGSFRFLTGDVNYTEYGGKWIRSLGLRRFHVIELLNWSEAVGESESASMPTYNATLSEVDLSAIDCTSALESCGYALVDGTIVESHSGDIVASGESVDRCLVECCHGYGAAAPLWDESGNNYQRLIRAARAHSRSLDDAELHSQAMDRPVNRIGTSARSYMLGEFGFKARGNP